MATGLDTIALYTIILDSRGWVVTSVLLLCALRPKLFLGPISGVIADRFSRQRIMIVSDILRRFVVLGFLFVRRPDQLWIIYVLTGFSTRTLDVLRAREDSGDTIDCRRS
jgi:MFS family permease